MTAISMGDRPGHLPPAAKETGCPHCGEWMIRAWRYEVKRTLAVWWCLDGCGAEQPPYLTQTPNSRPCAWCGEPFEPHWLGSNDRACSLACADTLALLTHRRRSNGRALRRRPPA